MGLEHIKASAPVADILAVLERDGGVVVEGIFPREVISEMHEGILNAARGFAPGAASQGLGEDGKAFVGHNTIRFSSLGKISPAFFQMVDNDLYNELASSILLPHCGSYWVNTGQAMLIGPDSPAQVLHRDCDNWVTAAYANWPDNPEVTFSAMIALEEITEEMGATRVIPGSHRWEDPTRRGLPEETVPAEMSPGDALLYLGRTVHGGGANQTSDRWRHAMHLSYVVGWLTPEESHPLDYTAEELAAHSPRLQRLLGHHSYDPRPHRGGGLWLRHADSF